MRSEREYQRLESQNRKLHRTLRNASSDADAARTMLEKLLGRLEGMERRITRAIVEARRDDNADG